MVERHDEEKALVTDEELDALLQPRTVLQLSSYEKAFATKTPLFKLYFYLISMLGALYVGSFMIGALDNHLAFGWSELREHHDLSRLRFVAGFIMLAIVHVGLLAGQRLETLFMCFIGLLTYILVSGTSNLIALDGAINDPWFMGIYVSIQSLFILLLLLLIREERRSIVRLWQLQDV
tara:strand:+ start:290 stop:823 length:534 start_codon:yes stop_codon:yes gene_type:complete